MIDIDRRYEWSETFPSYAMAASTDTLPSVYLVIRTFRTGDAFGRELFDASRDREEASRLIDKHSTLMPNCQWDIVEYVPTF